MNFENHVLKNEEKAIFRLRGLYQKYGYSQYKMSKFEEYDLYVRNKDFLVSDSVITFTDTNGKLMALKPDVTLSIIKNSKDTAGCVQKLYYNENVYRVSKGTHTFKEIMQVGLECIGDIDNYHIYETIFLALESLKSISEKYILDISHMGIITDALDMLDASDEVRAALLKCIGEKNVHEITQICHAAGIDEQKADVLKQLILLYGQPQQVIPKLRKIIQSEKMTAAVNQLELLTDLLSKNGYGQNIRIDFSLINDMHYYNGVVFKGFVEGIPTGILSGGQYDKLLEKLGRKSGAIGFAVYLDLLERLHSDTPKYDVDAVVLYDTNTDLEAISMAVRQLADAGKSVMAQTSVPDKIRYRQLLKLQGKEMEILENNA